MPTYEYKCKKCGTRFEKEQRMVDPPLKKCPKCKGEVFRLISKNVGIAFKGSGFYSNDSKNSSSPFSSCPKQP